MILNVSLNIVNRYWDSITYNKQCTCNMNNIAYTTLCNKYTLSVDPHTK